MKCVFCTKEVVFLKSVVMNFNNEKAVCICFNCIKLMNNAVAIRTSYEGWFISKDALIVNNKKEFA